jgi:hypothetical protein
MVDNDQQELDVQKKIRNRELFLQKIYDESQGSTTNPVSLTKISKDMSLPLDQIVDYYRYYKDKGFLKSYGNEKALLTQQSIDFVENKLLDGKNERKGRTIAVSTKNPKIIFISHINEDEQIALQLKALLLKIFSDKIKIFVSSDKKSIPYGKEWFPPIKQNLFDCDVALILCSPISIARPWINFEAGASAILDRPTIPMCYSGQKCSELPEPLYHYQGADAEKIEDLTGVIEEISHVIEIPLSIVDISQSDFFKTVCSLGAQKPADRPHIEAAVRSTSIIKGENVVIVGSTSYPNSKVEIELFKFGDDKDKMRVFSAPTVSNGSFEFLSRSDSFDPGLYGVTIQQPDGEWTKVQFEVKDEKIKDEKKRDH